MNVAAPEPKQNMGQPAPRTDGRLKVTGAARYAADFPVGNPAYAFLVTSPIAKGTIRGFELGEARAVPGVLEILTYENAGKLKPAEFTGSGGTATTTIQPLASPRIWHDGQIIAVVIADSFEAAREAAYKFRADFDAQPPSATFDSPGTETQLAKEVSKRH